MEPENRQGNRLQIRSLQQPGAVDQHSGSPRSLQGPNQLAKADEKWHVQRLLLGTRVQGIRQGLRKGSKTPKEIRLFMFVIPRRRFCAEESAPAAVSREPN